MKNADTKPKGCNQSSMKNVTNKTLRSQSSKEEKLPDNLVGNSETDYAYIESNKVRHGKTMKKVKGIRRTRMKKASKE